jgi:ubiquinone/menaquinone biosynthesis C-methylase UbiE
MDRKSYIANEYSKYWVKARDDIYGFMEYDKNLCEYICKNIPGGSKLLEVAIGTGYPFADYLQKHGYNVYGIDISPLLIEKCKELNPEIICKVGDAEKLEYDSGSFDCTYCFHSTWYFPDLSKVIDEMIRVTRQGGLVIFDIQNRNNPEIDHNFRKRIFYTRGAGRVIRYVKNIAKIILRRGFPHWGSIVWETPTFPEKINKHLKSKNLINYHIFVRMDDDTLEIQTKIDSFPIYKRLVFAIRTPA